MEVLIGEEHSNMTQDTLEVIRSIRTIGVDGLENSTTFETYLLVF